MKELSKAVKIVTIKNSIPLFKGEAKAEKIELLQFDEVGYEVVSQKDKYSVGHQAILILPDYCVSELPLFDDFIAPNGNKSKSYLGKIEGEPRRIRAKKFNFHKGDGKSVYSNGILLSMVDIEKYIALEAEKDYSTIEEAESAVANALGITKYKEPEKQGNLKTGDARKGGFPSGVYKTDETNIETIWNHIEYPITLIGTEKVDGSSITIGLTDNYPNGFIASRNINKALTVRTRIGERKIKFIERLMFWKDVDLNIYEETLNDDSFVIHGMPYLNLLRDNGLNNIILRGELYGSASKGSGNKNNPHAKYRSGIRLFYIDRFEGGVARKMSRADFRSYCYEYNFSAVKEYFEKTFYSEPEIRDACESVFESQKANKRIIEGLVLSTLDNSFSCKYMNNEYDSKK